jgi:hypothetical protein
MLLRDVGVVGADLHSGTEGKLPRSVQGEAFNTKTPSAEAQVQVMQSPIRSSYENLTHERGEICNENEKRSAAKVAWICFCIICAKPSQKAP